MVVKLKSLSGDDLVKIFERFGFVVVAQKGSHMKMRRMTIHERQTLAIPAHSPIPNGTLKEIFNQGARYIPDADLRPHFYSADR